MARSNSPPLTNEVTHRFGTVVVHDRFGDIGQTISGVADELFDARFVDHSRAAGCTILARIITSQAAWGLRRHAVMHLPQKARRCAGKRINPVGRHRSPAAHADFGVYQEH